MRELFVPQPQRRKELAGVFYWLDENNLEQSGEFYVVTVPSTPLDVFNDNIDGLRQSDLNEQYTIIASNLFGAYKSVRYVPVKPNPFF
jgi:hypothetical protein